MAEGVDAIYAVGLLYATMMLQDLRHAGRMLRRSPGFTAVALITLALAIGATTATFSVVYGVLLRPLPFTDPNRIMAIFEVNTKGTWSRLADPNFDDFRDQNRSFEAIAKYSSYIESIAGAAAADTCDDCQRLSGLFQGLSRPAYDRPRFQCRGHEERRDAGCSGQLRILEAGARLVAGAFEVHLKIDGLCLLGYWSSAPEFSVSAEDVALWLPADRGGENTSRTSHNYSAVGRLRDGVTVAQANQEISAIARRIRQ